MLFLLAPLTVAGRARPRFVFIVRRTRYLILMGWRQNKLKYIIFILLMFHHHQCLSWVPDMETVFDVRLCRHENKWSNFLIISPNWRQFMDFVASISQCDCHSIIQIPFIAFNWIISWHNFCILRFGRCERVHFIYLFSGEKNAFRHCHSSPITIYKWQSVESQKQQNQKKKKKTFATSHRPTDVPSFTTHYLPACIALMWMKCIRGVSAARGINWSANKMLKRKVRVGCLSNVQSGNNH